MRVRGHAVDHNDRTSPVYQNDRTSSVSSILTTDILLRENVILREIGVHWFLGTAVGGSRTNIPLLHLSLPILRWSAEQTRDLIYGMRCVDTAPLYSSPFRLTAFAYGSTLETTLGGMVSD